MIWLKDVPVETLRAQAQVHSAARGLVVKGVGSEVTWGVRVKPDQAVALRQQIDPRATANDGYLPIVHQYILQPLPPGCDASTVEQAKALKPVSRCAYRVGSTEPPPVDRVAHVCGDIVICAGQPL